MREIISNGLNALDLDSNKAVLLEKYCDLLLEQNKVMNLTAITEPDKVANLHILDCASILKACDFDNKKIIDIGTGAGFPGLVLKICQDNIKLTLLDALDKRVQWLSKTCEALEISGVECLHGRAEDLTVRDDLKAVYREQFDIATSRAVADLRMLCELCLPFVKVGGMFLAMKSVDCQNEIDLASRSISILGGQLKKSYDYTIPDTDVTHRVVIIEKVRSTPEKYPRRFAKIKKMPL